MSLRTRSFRTAKIRATTLAAQLEEEWIAIRWRSNANPLRKYLFDDALSSSVTSDAPLLSEAREIYVQAKGRDRPVTFGQAVDRAISTVVKVVGDKPIDLYKRPDAIYPLSMRYKKL